MPLAPGLTLPAGGRLFHAKIFSKSAGKMGGFSSWAMGGGSWSCGGVGCVSSYYKETTRNRFIANTKKIKNLSKMY